MTSTKNTSLAVSNELVNSLKRESRNSLKNLFVVIDELSLQHRVPLVFTEVGLSNLKTVIKNGVLSYIDSAMKNGHSESYAVQCAVNNGLSRIQALK